MLRELLPALLAGVVALLAGMMVFRYWFAPAEFASAPELTTPAPSSSAPLHFAQIRLTNLDGTQQSLSHWTHPILLVNFWAPWCAPCRREIPALIELQQRYPQQLQIVGLSFDSQDNVQDFRQNFEFNYPLLLVGAEASALNRFFGNSSGGLPFTAVLSKERAIVARHSGELDEAQLNAMITPLLTDQ